MTLLRRFGFDLLIVVGAVQSAFAVALADGPNAPTAWFGPLGVGLLVLALIGRHWWPFGAPVALWLLAAALSFADGRLVVYSTTVMLAGTASAFLLGNLADARQRRIGLVVLVCAAAIVSYNDPNHATGDLMLQPALFVIAWLAGYGLRGRAEQAEAAEQRAAQAERDRETAARIAVAEERSRIARELHDIVAHAVSVMVLQTGAVRHRLPASDDREALVEVEKTGRAALTEMRRLLGALREDDDLELAPQPGLATLDSLVEAFRRSGLPVQVQVDGEEVPLPRALDLSAYRIVQEALTNTRRHARATRACVRLSYGPDALQVEITDDGRGPVNPRAGHGLIGMRERAALYGGSLDAGPTARGGFRVAAAFPLGADR